MSNNFILRWLERRDRKRVIMDRVNDAPYLERYYVFLKDRTRFQCVFASIPKVRSR